MFKAFKYPSSRKKASEPLGANSDRLDPTNALAEATESVDELAVAPPPLVRGNTKLRTPYEVRGYELSLTLSDRPSAPLFLSIRSGAGVWSTSEVPAEQSNDSLTNASPDGNTAAAAGDSDKVKVTFMWPRERLSLRLMHPSQDLSIQLFTVRNGLSSILAQGRLRGQQEHPAIGAERKVTVRLRPPPKQASSNRAGDRIVSMFSAPKLPASSRTKIGSLTLKVYFLTPDDFSVIISDLHAMPSVTPRKGNSTASYEADALPLSQSNVRKSSPLPLDLPGVVDVSTTEELQTSFAGEPLGSLSKGTPEGIHERIDESANKEDDASGGDLDDESFAALEQARDDALASMLAVSFETDATSHPAPLDSPTATPLTLPVRLPSTPLAPLVNPTSVAHSESVGAAPTLTPNSSRSGGDAAIVQRAQLLMSAATALENGGVVGSNVKQSLNHLLQQVAGPQPMRSHRLMAWVEDLVWDLANLGGGFGLLAFHSIYGPAFEYPICPLPLASVPALLPNLTNRADDIHPLTFGLKAHRPSGASFAFRAESPADFVRWTAAIASFLGGATVDPFLSPSGRGTVPRYCRIGSAEGRKLELGLLGGSSGDYYDDDDDEGEKRAAAVVAGWLWRKKQHRSSASSITWVRRYFTLRALPPASMPTSSSSSASEPPIAVAWLEWTHSSKKRGSASVALDPAALSLVEPFAPSSSSPPGYLADVSVLAIRGLTQHSSKKKKQTGKKSKETAAKDSGKAKKRLSAADQRIAAAALKSTTSAASVDSPSAGVQFSDDPLDKEEAPWVVVRRVCSPAAAESEESLELRTPPAETLRTPLNETGNGSSADVMMMFGAGTALTVPVQGTEKQTDGASADSSSCQNGVSDDSNSSDSGVLETTDALIVALFRKSPVRGAVDVCLGSALVKIDAVPFSCRRHLAVPLMALPAKADPWALNKSTSSRAKSKSSASSVVATVHLALEARRVLSCVTKWPCAWVNLTNNNTIDDSTISASAATAVHTDPLPLSLACSSPFNDKSQDDVQPLASSLVCQAAPEALFLLPGSKTRAAGEESACLLRVPWECVVDLLVVSPGCLHLHLSARNLSEAARQRILGQGSDAAIQHMQDVGKCAMEERVRNTVIRAKQEGISYAVWLVKSIGEGDYDTEFVSRTRRNDK